MPEVWYPHMDGGMVAWARWCSVSLAGEHVLRRSSRGQPEVTEVPMFSSVSSADRYLWPRSTEAGSEEANPVRSHTFLGGRTTAGDP